MFPTSKEPSDQDDPSADARFRQLGDALYDAGFVIADLGDPHLLVIPIDSGVPNGGVLMRGGATDDDLAPFREVGLEDRHELIVAYSVRGHGPLESIVAHFTLRADAVPDV